MGQPFPPPPLGPRMLRCHHPAVPAVAPHPTHEPCSLPFPRSSCLRVQDVPKSTLTSKSMRAALMPYDHQTTIYKLDFCSPPCVRTKVQVPCPTRGAPLGRTAGIIPEYVGTCGGGPIKPQPRRVYGVMGPPPLRYSFGRTEYQAKVGRLGAAILKCRAKRAATCTCLVPYGTAPPCRCVGRGPRAPTRARPPCTWARAPASRAGASSAARDRPINLPDESFYRCSVVWASVRRTLRLHKEPATQVQSRAQADESAEELLARRRRGGDSAMKTTQ